MSEAPERIWIDDERKIGGVCHVFCEDDPAHEYADEYIRTDLVQPQIDAAVAAAYEDAASRVNELSHTATATGNFTQASALANEAEAIRARGDTVEQEKDDE